MTSNEKIIDRIRKLLSLSASPEPHEAANALATAQRLMHQHRVEQSQVDAPDEDEIQIYVDEPIEAGMRIPPWKQAVGGAIADLNDCLCLVSDRRVGPRQHRVMILAGRRVDFDVCAAMYRWIVDIIDKAAVQSCELAGYRHRRTGMGRRWLESFRTGAGAEVEARLLREQRDQRAQLAADPRTSTALALRHDAVHDWADENLDARDSDDSAPDVDADAFAAGARVGRVLPLRREREREQE